MNVVKSYGRNCYYDFEKDDKLAFVKQGELRTQSINDKNKATLSIDGFMTIWLLTLPEKFLEWHQFHKN